MAECIPFLQDYNPFREIVGLNVCQWNDTNVGFAVVIILLFLILMKR